MEAASFSELLATVSLVPVVCAAVVGVLPSTSRTSLAVGWENGGSSDSHVTTSLSDTYRKKRQDYPKSRYQSNYFHGATVLI